MTIQASRAVGTSYSQPANRQGRLFTPKRFLTPLIVLGVLLLLWLVVSNLQLDDIEKRTLNSDYIQARTWEHVKLALLSSVLVVLIAIPLGILVSRAKSKWVTGVALSVANIGQAAPVIGVLVLFTMIIGAGFKTAIIGLVIYALLPVLRNTLIGLEQVDRGIIEASRGMGMTRNQILRRIELPLAVPVIAAGVRTALVFCVGAATIATFVNAGGLGDIIVNGIKLQRDVVLITGAVLTACIALMIDWIGGIVEDLVRPKGI